MASTGVKGSLATLGFGAGTPTAVAQIIDLSGPNFEVDDIDISNRDSTAREFLSGLVDAGQIEFEIVYNKTESATLYGKKGASDTWTVTFPDGSKFVCGGFISSFGWEVPYEDKISCSCTIEVSGKPTFTVA